MSRTKPRNSLVLIRIPDEAEQRSETGLYLPNIAGTQFRICEIVEVGNGTPEIHGLDTEDLSIGQKVLAKVGNKQPQPGGLTSPIQWSCIPLSKDADDGLGLFLINQADIFAIISDEEPESEPKPLTLTETNEMETSQ